MRPINRSSQGFTLIELLVVISIIAILAGMLFPAISIVRRNAAAADCGNNLKGIFTACIAYQQDYGSWPAVPKRGATSMPTGATDGREAVYSSFEVLAATNDLPDKLFKCKSADGIGPQVPPLKNRTDNGWYGALNTGTNPSYAFDYAAPGEPSPIRVMAADRNCKNHQNNVMAVYGDSHVTKLAAKAGAATGTRTDGALSGYVVFNPSSKGADGHEDDTTPDPTDDDIYTFNGDYPSTASPVPTGFALGDGSSRRAFLK